MNLSRHFTSEEDLKNFAALVGDHLQPGDILLFEGPLGVGKSTFIRALLRHLCQDPTLEVPSPTFTLIQTYNTPQGDIWHVDLYRLDNASDVEELGLFEMMGEATMLIEWPDRLEGRLPEDYLLLRFAYGETPDERTIAFQPKGDWVHRMHELP